MFKRKTIIPQKVRDMLTHVPLPQSKNIYTSFPEKNSGNSNSNMPSYLKTTDELIKGMKYKKNKEIEIISGKRGLSETQRAMEKVRKGAPIAIYDIENLGEPAIGNLTGEKTPLFGITQIALGVSKNSQALSKGEITVNNIVFKQTDEVKDKLTNMLNRLENNWQSYDELTEREKGSLADLTTFSNKDLFGKKVTIGNKTYKVLPEQEKAINTSITALTDKDNISLMRKGLENITNPELTTDPSEIVDLISHLRSTNTVMMGYNSERHDKPGLMQELRAQKAPKEVLNYVMEPQADIMRIAQDVLNTPEGAKVRNYQLGIVYEQITSKPFGDIHSHNAGDDVKATAAVFSELEKMSNLGKNVKSKTIKVNDKFHVETGINFQQNDFNQNAGQYDMVTKINPDTGKHELQYNKFRRGTGRGNILQFHGETRAMDIDGIRHFGVSFFNEEEETYHHFFRANRGEIDDIFEQNLINYGEMSQDQIDYIEQDNLRRRYTEIFTKKASSSSDTVSNRLQTADKIIETYEAHYEKLKSQGSDEDTLHNSAIKDTLEEINKGKSDYKFGRKRVEETVKLKDRLRKDKEIIDMIGESAKAHAGLTGDERTRTERENLYYKQAFTKLSDIAGKSSYGYDGLSMLKLPDLSNPGEFTYKNVTSSKQMQAVVRKELRQDLDRAGEGKTGVHFNRLIDQVGEAIDDEERNHLQRLVHRDLREGQISSGTIDEITNTIYRKQELLKSNGVIVDSVLGFDLEKPFANVVLQDGLNLLNKEKSNFSKEFRKDSEEYVDRHIARGSAQSNSGKMSKEITDRFKKSDETQKQLREGVVGTNHALGKKFGRRNIYANNKAKEQVEDVISKFESEGFQVKLQQVDGSDRLLFFASPDSSLDMREMTIDELQSHGRVFGAPLPLYNQNSAIDTVAGEMRDMHHLKVNLSDTSNINNLRTSDVRIETTSDLIFKELGYSARNIKSSIKDGETIEDSVNKARGRLYRQSSSLGIPSGYRTESAEKSGYTAMSREANRMILMNSNEYLEEYAKENYPNKYAKFLERRKRNNDANILDVFNAGELSQLRIEAFSNFNEVIGAQTGVYMRAEGLNPNQAARGVVSLMPASLALPFGQMHSPVREQANKSINYRTINRKPLESFFERQYGEESLVAQIATAPAQTAFSNLLDREEGVRAYEIATLQLGDSALALVGDELSENYKKEFEELTKGRFYSQLSDEEKNQYSELKRIMNVLDSGLTSTFEDQYLMDEDLLGSISSSEHLEIELKNYEITSGLRRLLDDTAESQSELKPGVFEFDSSLTYEQMQEIDLVSSDGVLIVGQLAQDVIVDNSGFEYGEAKKRRIQKGAQLHAVRVNEEGKATLILDNRYEGLTGYKTLRGDSSARETAVSVPSRLIQDIAKKVTNNEDLEKIYAISAFEKSGPGGRRSTGSMYTNLITTSSHNIASAIDSLYDGSETTGISAVDNYFEGRELTGDRHKDYQDYIRNKFIPDVNKALGSEQIGFYDEPGAEAFEFLTPSMPGTAEERQGFLQNLTELAIEDYGLDMGQYEGNDYMVSSRSMIAQNIPYWQGRDVKARYGRIEFDLIDQTLMGPTEQEILDFREFGEKFGNIAGTNMKNYQGFSREKGKSIISENLRQLSKETGNREEVAEYIQRIQSAREFHERGGLMEEAARGGNVIVDIAGDYDFEEGSNFLTIGEGDESYTVVDGSTIGVVSRGGMPTGADIRNTYRNIYSVELYGDGVETTIGDLVKEQNSSAFVRLMDPDHPVAKSAELQNEVVEVVPMLKSERDSLGEVYLRPTELDQARAFEAAYDLIHGAPNAENSSRWRSKRIGDLNRNLESFIESSEDYIGSDAAQKLIEIRENNSFSANLQGRNFLRTGYRARDVVMSEEQARLLLEGRVDTVLDANKIALEDIINIDTSKDDFENLLTDTEIETAKEDYIINRLKGVAEEDDEFEFFSLINRQPSQHEGSLIYGSVRIDETASIDDNYISLDPRFAAAQGGDFDGDIAYASSYAYLENMSPERAVALQEELREMSNFTTNRAIIKNHEKMSKDISEEGINTLQTLLNLDDPIEVEEIFSDNLTEGNMMFQIASDEIMRSNVGAIYNSVVGTRDAINMFSDGVIAGSEDNIILNNMRSLVSNSTELMEGIQQNALSRKKIDPSSIEKFKGLERGSLSPSKMVDMAQSGELLEIMTEYDAARAAVPSSIRNITRDTATDIMDELERLQILEYKDNEEGIAKRNLDRETFIQMGTAQDALSTTAIGGFDNRFFSIGTSSASDKKIQFEEALRNTPEQVPVTSQTQALAEVIFQEEPEVIENWGTVFEESMTHAGEHYNNLISRAQESFSDSGNQDDLIKQLTASRMSEGSGDYIRSQSSFFSGAKSTVSEIGKSTAFRAAAGITAAWTVARAMSSGPTPEGNEAEQEMATAAEVAPSQLLTSPTARVTPGAQTVNLDIQASGNMSEQEVAGLINNEIAAMTGSPMEMNINVNDNTARLDRKFYQRAVDRVFGF